MTEEEIRDRPGRAAAGALPEHPVRGALLDLLADAGTITSTEAARRLGYSSGLCSFHLRQLARYGRIEEAPRAGGRERPWRIRQAPPPAGSPPAEPFGELARGLEDDSYHRWLARRDQTPAEWRRDEAFSAVAYLTRVGVRRQVVRDRRVEQLAVDREQQPATRPDAARPVALIARLFPLLPGAADAES
ncbi:MAG TPA: ArsR family transcriptional regulator [Actinobacteria bacterium]|nr:ArsR family transcriptional regulator [Actinomycetota bacterium]